MNDWVEISENPDAKEKYMIVGWRQWADAGAISSGLPQYLIELTGARKIGHIRPDGFYLFQVPGTHHLFRPEVKLSEGYREELHKPTNEIFYSESDEKGLFIFLGDEPHMNAERYSAAFFDAVEALGVRRVAAVGGVYGEMPYDLDRDISCVYSLRQMKEELAEYAVRFSNYEGGSTIGTYLVDAAEKRQIEFLAFYAFVPAYNFGEQSTAVKGIRVENDYKAWYDLLRRFKHMFDLPVDLSDLEQKSDHLLTTVHAKLDQLADQMPQLNIPEYLDALDKDFDEQPFAPLSDVWQEGLKDLFQDSEE